MSDRDLYADGHVLGYTTALADIKAELQHFGTVAPAAAAKLKHRAAGRNKLEKLMQMTAHAAKAAGGIFRRFAGIECECRRVLIRLGIHNGHLIGEGKWELSIPVRQFCSRISAGADDRQ